MRIPKKVHLLKSLPYLLSLKNIHKGRQGFVIGNGPSLRISDLDRLKSEITIASNKIYLAFDQTRWRPDYLTCVDKLVWQDIQKEVFDHQRRIIISSYLDYGSPTGRTDVVRHLGEVGGQYVPKNGIQFSPNLLKGVFGGSTVTYENLQLAVHLGLNPIYIIGCDHYYHGESSVSTIAKSKVVETTNTKNHFISNYRSKGQKVFSASIDRMTKAYREARKFSNESGTKILNATRGGHLEAFERVHLDSVLNIK